MNLGQQETGRRKARALVLAAMPGTQTEIQQRTGLGRTTVWRWIKDAHEAGEVHIVKWSRLAGGGPFQPTYALGPGKDVPCKLEPFTEQQKSARYRRRARADGRWEERNARIRARDAANRANYGRDPLLAAFFGKRAA